jgi:cellulose synthase/poly-beta-1,6-N-acetylglucosamine synthase-like glycosyltransferase
LELGRRTSIIATLTILTIAALLGPGLAAVVAGSAPPAVAQESTTAPTTEPPTTSPPTTAPATSTTDDSGGTAPVPTTAPAGVAPGTDPGSGAPTTAGGTEDRGGERSGTGAGDPADSLRGSPPGQAAARIVEAVRREVQSLSPGELILTAVLSLFSLVLTVIALTSLWWMLHAWRTPESLSATGFAATGAAATGAAGAGAAGAGAAGAGAAGAGAATEPRHRFSLIVPARHEEAVLAETLERLVASDHPDFEVIAVVGDDDPATEEVAREVASRHPDRVRVVVDASDPKSKPKALNTALPACSGDVVGVFDAEDEVHPELLRHVDARFTETGADIVQGGVQLMNHHSSWYAVRNVLEYYFWFRSRLHFHAERRFIPLGGNTVFTRTELLRRHGGWDPECLAEDCELGVRLSSAGASAAVAYDPRLVTREETPGSLGALLKQRTRWNQGFLQVLRKGEWRRLPTWRQRLLARYTLAMPFLQAFTGVLVPLSLAAMILLRVPVLIALITFVPLVPTLMSLVVEIVGLSEFCRTYGTKARLRDYLRLVAGAFPYHLLLSIAALRAVTRELRGERGWEKTAHAGLHRQPASASSSTAASGTAASGKATSGKATSRTATSGTTKANWS